ncbi:MAG: hypothetical protein M1495_19900 [Bacteroidetes bacterium]|nr:hypothetical protein [Bacteroidota bacterium]
MKLFKKSSAVLIIISIAVLITLFLNLVLDIYPVLSFFKYMENKKIYWTIPTTVIILLVVWLLHRMMKKEITNERIEIFTATIRTMQDILQNSTSSMQLLVLDMKDENVNEGIVMKAEKNIDELKKVIKALSSVDPETIELKELNRNLSVIKINELKELGNAMLR